MKLTIVPEAIIDTSYLSGMIDEVVGNLSTIEDIKETAKKFKLPNFKDLYDDIEKCRKISAVGKALDVNSFSVFTERFYAIQNSKNILMSHKDKIISIKRQWGEIKSLIDSVYNIEKNRMLLFEFVRSLRNKELQQAVVDISLHDLIGIKTKINMIVGRIEDVNDDLQEAFNYLDSTYSLISRQFTVVQLGSDLGQVRS